MASWIGRLLLGAFDPQYPVLEKVAFDDSVVPRVGDLLHQDSRLSIVLLMHCRQTGEILVVLGKDEGVRGLHEERPVDYRPAQEDRIPKTERLELIEENEIGGSDPLVEVIQVLARLSLLAQELEELEIGGEVIFDGSLASSDDDVERPDSDGVQLLEDGLNHGFELEGVVSVPSDDRKHFFGNLLGKREKPRADPSGRDKGSELAEPRGRVDFSGRLNFHGFQPPPV